VPIQEIRTEIAAKRNLFWKNVLTHDREHFRSSYAGSPPWDIGKPQPAFKIREWYSRGDGKGVIFLVDVKTEDEANLLRYNSHDLLWGYARFGCQYDQHCGGFRYSHAGHA